ncbi:MAG: NUDIX hydrolase [Polyangiaceae bacterium]
MAPHPPLLFSETLPELPDARVVLVRERAVHDGFISVRRLDVALAVGSEAPSAPFVYDVVERRALDAAAVAAHFVKDGVRWVILRSAIRPPFALAGAPVALWELPAGLIEPGEAPIEAAARELNEEIGTALTAARVRQLGPALIPVPAMIAERQHLFHVEIDPAELGAPAGDGSVLEEVAVIVAVPLAAALDMARRGELPDSKTELGLRRLAEVLA